MSDPKTASSTLETLLALFTSGVGITAVGWVAKLLKERADEARKRADRERASESERELARAKELKELQDQIRATYEDRLSEAARHQEILRLERDAALERERQEHERFREQLILYNKDVPPLIQQVRELTEALNRIRASRPPPTTGK